MNGGGAASGGRLKAVKVGDDWVVPGTAVTARAASRQTAEVVTYP